MHSDERRKAIADVLRAADAPVSASALAEKFSVSRQIIVGDIALLRSSGEEILATPRGYVTPKEARGILRCVAVKHTPQEMEAELNTIVPVVIFYLCCQKYIIKGVAAGAVKG